MLSRRTFKSAFLAGIAALTALALLACTDSGSHLFDSEEYAADTEAISVQAFATISFDSSATRLKSDTIRPGDTLIFNTAVYPSKSIRNKRYYWLLDSLPFAKEFSFRNTILETGVHDVIFVFVDYFGDTLSDTLSITVASPPTLDTAHFIPAAGTQNIEPDAPLNFAWNSPDSDPLNKVTYRFTLRQAAGKVIVDTLLDQTVFTYLAGFKPLERYDWSVSAENQFLQKSQQSISGHFFVKGASQENALRGNLYTHSETVNLRYHIWLENTATGNSQEIDTKANTFTIAPLPDGEYSLTVSIPDYPDFTPVQVPVTLKGERIRELDSLVLDDVTAPTIASVSGKDTIALADTLRFTLHDGGGEIRPSKVNLLFDGKNLQDFALANDTLKIPFDTGVQNWSYKLLSINVIDNSGNRSGKTFYLKPNTTLSEVFGE